MSETIEKGNIVYPLYKEMAINEEGQILDDRKEIIIVEGIEAIKVWVFKNFKTWRNKYKLYSSSFGTDLYENIGFVYDKTTKQQLMYSEIIDSCKVLPYITNVSNFSSDVDYENGNVAISFKITTIYGEYEEVLNV
ncbi:MAG: DUF2634 domain-containing protein [Fusobacteriaceae bacterium]